MCEGTNLLENECIKRFARGNRYVADDWRILGVVKVSNNHVAKRLHLDAVDSSIQTMLLYP